ncbi:MAG: hypothetical protein KGQ42_04245 [Alphaproteobacteria bacterium]|nr:hypothetical protein [Alphaproteobacteria bacterium]
MANRQAALAAILYCMIATTAAHADQATTANLPKSDSAGHPSQSAVIGTVISKEDKKKEFLDRWQERVHRAQESQPQWITPIATVTPRLEQEFRFDMGFQAAADGTHLANYGSGKGLELIPTTSNEVIFNLPSYENRTDVKPAQGFGDDPVLLIKQRLISANEVQGNYIVSTFLGVQAPSGNTPFTNHAWSVTPTLAAGKGWGQFDVQATVGVSFPLSRESVIGTSMLTNIAFQYHLSEIFWPEFEINSTHWFDGPRSGKTQIYLTPGVILGRFALTQHTKAIMGIGYQFVVAPPVTTAPVLTPLYNHQLIMTFRIAF